MFVLGHLGIGSRLAAPFHEARERRWMLLGALLPDLIDKPLYYGLSFATGRRGAALGLFSGTRTFGHTALFALLIWLLFRKRHGAALVLGMATHLLLDELGDVVGLFAPARPGFDSPPTAAAVLWPALGVHFPIAPFTTVGEHVAALATGYVIAGELIGGALLAWERWRRRPADKTIT